MPSAKTKLDAVTGAVCPIIDPCDIMRRRLCVNGLVDNLFIDDHYSVVASSDAESQPELHLSSDEGPIDGLQGKRMLPILQMPIF